MAIDSYMPNPSSSIAGTLPPGLIARNSGDFVDGSAKLTLTCSKSRPSSRQSHITRIARDALIPYTLSIRTPLLSVLSMIEKNRASCADERTILSQTRRTFHRESRQPWTVESDDAARSSHRG